MPNCSTLCFPAGTCSSQAPFSAALYMCDSLIKLHEALSHTTLHPSQPLSKAEPCSWNFISFLSLSLSPECLQPAHFCARKTRPGFMHS